MHQSSAEKAENPSQGGVLALETGLTVLNALVAHPQAMMLKDIAAITGMPPAKVHRYLVSFARCGYVYREASGRYTLAGASVRLGLSALARQDPIRLAMPVIEELVAQTGQMALVAVWGDAGPTVVYWQDAPQAVSVRVKPGAVLPLLGSATGLVYAAFLQTDEVKATLKKSFKQYGYASAQSLETRLDEIRKNRLGILQDNHIMGISAMSAPVFNHTGHIELALTSSGMIGSFDSRPEGDIVKALMNAASNLSRELGHADNVRL